MDDYADSRGSRRPERSPARTSSTARCAHGAWRTSSVRRACASSSRSRCRPRRRRGEPLDHVLLAGPPGLGKTSLAQIIADRARRPVRADGRPGARAQGRHRRAADRARAERRLLRRRDPPPQPRARGDVLPGDGGRAPADHDRAGRRRSGRDARAAAVHARRRDDARRAAVDAAARPLRHPAPPRDLRTRRARDDRAPLGARSSASSSTTTGRSRSPRAAAARRASRIACCAACATGRRSAERAS